MLDLQNDTTATMGQIETTTLFVKVTVFMSSLCCCTCCCFLFIYLAVLSLKMNSYCHITLKTQIFLICFLKSTSCVHSARQQRYYNLT